MSRLLATLAAFSLAAPAAFASGPVKPAPVDPKAAHGAGGGRLAGAHLTCTTLGDALGGLDVTAAGSKVTVKESTMAGTTTTATAPARGEQVFALAGGKGATFILPSKKSAEFGGGVSEATLLVIGARAEKGNKREGWMARSGMVYVLSCE